MYFTEADKRKSEAPLWYLSHREVSYVPCTKPLKTTGLMRPERAFLAAEGTLGKGMMTNLSERLPAFATEQLDIAEGNGATRKPCSVHCCIAACSYAKETHPDLQFYGLLLF